MRNLNAPGDAPFGSPDFPIPPSPVQELRHQISLTLDAASRMLDAADGDLLSSSALAYLNKQLERAGKGILAAAEIIRSVEICDQAAAIDDDEWVPDEIVELTLPLRDDLGGEGGVA
jgi:hypothetical protein